MAQKICTALILIAIALIISEWRTQHNLPTLKTMIKQDLVANGTISPDPAPEVKPAPSTKTASKKQETVAGKAKPKLSAPTKARKTASKANQHFAYTDNAAAWGGH